MTEAPRAPLSPLAGDDAQLLVALRAEASALRRTVACDLVGLTRDDLVSAGWLGYAESRAETHAGRMCRARGAMLDEIRRWHGGPSQHDPEARATWQWVQGDDALAAADAIAVQEAERHAAQGHHTRTRLPRRVRRALGQLPVRERRALWLWTVRGWPHEEIAAALGTSVGTSGRLRSQALGRLRTALAVAA